MIGSYRHEVEVLVPTRNPDGAGGAEIVWLSAGRFWAKVRRLTTATDVAGDRRRRLRRIAVTVRAGAEFAPGRRLVHAGLAYDIGSVEDADDAGRRLLVVAEEAAS